MESPIFLVGAQRSGTTLLRLMLDGHPQIAWPLEFDYAVEWPGHHEGDEWPPLAPYLEHLELSRLARDARTQADPTLNFPELARSLLDQLRERSSKPLFGVTVHRHYGRLVQLWPTARFIYLLRDGRDVARSHVELGWEGNAWAAAAVWREAEQSWRDAAERIPPMNRIEVRFEALVKAPELELRRICDFLAVPYDDGMLRYPAHSTYGAPDARMAERWRENLTTRELALLERELGDELRGRGYPPSEVAPARISALQRLALRAGAKLGVLRFRARRYGFFLWLRHHLALRLHLRALRRDSLLRMQAIDVAHLK